MIGAFLALSLGGVLIAIVVRWTSAESQRRVVGTLLGGYTLRLALQSFLRDIPFFSHGAGGDCMLYEAWARLVVLIWDHGGVEYMTQDKFPELGQTTLPVNLYALVMWANGGPTRLGCTAVIAFVACLTCFNLYKVALELGTKERHAQLLMTLLLFEPAFLMYTSDMYKDGLVAFLVIGALGSAFRVSRRFSLLHIFIGVFCMATLWLVRYYLIFVTVAPLIVGLSGLTSRSLARPILATLGLLAVGIFLASYTHTFNAASETFSRAFETGTSQAVIEDNSTQHGSGVAFNDGGNPFGKLYLKLPYAVFSPFPWQSGSVGFHIGKLSSFLFTYFIYNAVRAGRRLFREDRKLLLMFLTFLVPTTFMYALGMSNIGLVVRERIPIVLMTGVLSFLRVTTVTESEPEAEPEAEEDVDQDELPGAAIEEA